MPRRATGVQPALASGLLVLCVAGCAGSRARPGLLAPRGIATVIDSILTTAPLAGTSWGIAAWDVDARRWLIGLNAERHYIPASNTKLVVTTVALDELGPDYRYETPVFARMQKGDTVAQELVVVGRGDPTFSARFHADDFTVTDSLADQIAAAGIRRIAGDITVDASFFGDLPINGTWEVGDLPSSDAPPVEAFAIGEGAFRLVLKAGDQPGDPGEAVTTGPQGLQPLQATVRTDTAGARTQTRIDYMRHTDELLLTASLAAGRADTSEYAVTQPARYAGRALIWALRARGIRVDGAARVLRDSTAAAALRARLGSDYQRVATAFSPPLSDIIAGILRPSQNWMAEQLLKTLGAERRGSGGWNTGIDVERRRLIDVMGIDSLSFQLRDGSGLSAQNLLTPAAIVGVLEYARRAPWGAVYRAALPGPGMQGSTMAGRLVALQGRLSAKTGSITNVNTLSGWLTATDGHTVTFSIMTNGTGAPAATVRRAMDRIVELLAQGESSR